MQPEILEHFMLLSADKVYGDAESLFLQVFAAAQLYWSWYYCAWLTSQLPRPEPHKESKGHCQEEDARDQTQQYGWAESCYQSNLGFHSTSGVPQTVSIPNANSNSEWMKILFWMSALLYWKHRENTATLVVGRAFLDGWKILTISYANFFNVHFFFKSTDIWSQGRRDLCSAGWRLFLWPSTLLLALSCIVNHIVLCQLAWYWHRQLYIASQPRGPCAL